MSESWQKMAKIAQIVVLLATIALIAGLVIRPEESELVLWSIIIPVLPATFLVSPSIWRSVCPLATLNMLGDGRMAKRRLTREHLFWTEIAGVTLLMLLVPARRFLLNENGLVLGILIAVIAVAAAGLGLIWSSKGGFCNSICPVLPVEKLYGQAPLIQIKNPRCQPCDACTLKGCYDLDVRKSLAFALRGNGNTKQPWKATPFALFGAAFPGFIVGFYSVEDTVLAEALTVYGTVLGYALISGIVFHGLFRLLNVRSDIAAFILGALCVSLYYWFSGPAIATSLGLDQAVGTGIRLTALLLVGFWIYRFIRSRDRQESSPSPYGRSAN